MTSYGRETPTIRFISNLCTQKVSHRAVWGLVKPPKIKISKSQTPRIWPWEPKIAIFRPKPQNQPKLNQNIAKSGQKRAVGPPLRGVSSLISGTFLERPDFASLVTPSRTAAPPAHPLAPAAQLFLELAQPIIDSNCAQHNLSWLFGEAE